MTKTMTKQNFPLLRQWMEKEQLNYLYECGSKGGTFTGFHRHVKQALANLETEDPALSKRLREEISKGWLH